MSVFLKSFAQEHGKIIKQTSRIFLADEQREGQIHT